MRAAHDSLDPAKIGELVRGPRRRLAEGRASCAVLATDLDGQVVPLARPRAEPALTERAIAVAAGCSRMAASLLPPICGTTRGSQGRAGRWSQCHCDAAGAASARWWSLDRRAVGGGTEARRWSRARC